MKQSRLLRYFRSWFFRHLVPGIGGLNFVLENSLDGGGIASTRPDPLGKSFAQMLLDLELEGMPK